MGDKIWLKGLLLWPAAGGGGGSGLAPPSSELLTSYHDCRREAGGAGSRCPSADRMGKLKESGLGEYGDRGVCELAEDPSYASSCCDEVDSGDRSCRGDWEMMENVGDRS